MKRLAPIAILLALTATAAADDTADSAPGRLLGVGYKLGDGIGFYGADVIVGPAPHVVLDLYGTVVRVSSTSSTGDTATGTGFAVAPAVQYHLFAGDRSTPYLALGFQYVSLSVGDASASGAGAFANIGYEWKWSSGLGIELGGGVQYLSKIEATSGNTTVTTGGQVNPNLEFGIRYMFL